MSGGGGGRGDSIYPFEGSGGSHVVSMAELYAKSKKKKEVDIKNTHALNRHREAKIERSMKPRRKQKPFRAHVT